MSVTIYKSILMILFGLLCVINTQAQTQEWKLIAEQNGVNVYRAYSKCENQPSVFIKVENLNNKDVSVNWKSKFIMMGNDVLTDDSKTVIVKALSTSIGDCASNSLAINPYKFVSTIEPGMVDYSLSNLVVNEL